MVHENEELQTAYDDYQSKISTDKKPITVKQNVDFKVRVEEGSVPRSSASSFHELKANVSELTDNVSSSEMAENQIIKLQSDIFLFPWVVKGGFFAGHIVNRNSDVRTDKKVSGHIKKILDEFEKAAKKDITYRNALKKIIKIAIKESDGRTWLANREQSTQKFYNDIFKNLNVNATATLSKIEEYINDTTKSKNWGMWTHERPTTVDTILEIIQAKNNARPENKLKQILLLAMSASETNNQWTNFRSDVTKNFYENITNFIVVGDAVEPKKNLIIL